MEDGGEVDGRGGCPAPPGIESSCGTTPGRAAVDGGAPAWKCGSWSCAMTNADGFRASCTGSSAARACLSGGSDRSIWAQRASRLYRAMSISIPWWTPTGFTSGGAGTPSPMLWAPPIVASRTLEISTAEGSRAPKSEPRSITSRCISGGSERSREAAWGSTVFIARKASTSGLDCVTMEDTADSAIMEINEFGGCCLAGACGAAGASGAGSRWSKPLLPLLLCGLRLRSFSLSLSLRGERDLSLSFSLSFFSRSLSFSFCRSLSFSFSRSLSLSFSLFFSLSRSLLFALSRESDRTSFRRRSFRLFDHDLDRPSWFRLSLSRLLDLELLSRGTLLLLSLCFGFR
mmetsp:Transcript_50870/g.145384  ORF Transcript_50870/g.145384 Transcript_50870/m.145384 type:complete len:345 (+) Transcript_50870:114-1148(+)